MPAAAAAAAAAAAVTVAATKDAGTLKSKTTPHVVLQNSVQDVRLTKRSANHHHPRGVTQDPALEKDKEAATRKALFLKKRNDPSHAAAPLSSRSKKPSLAEIEAAKLEERLQFVQAKQAAVTSAYLSSAPLKAKASRPSSALVASCLPFHPSSLYPDQLLSAGQKETQTQSTRRNNKLVSLQGTETKQVLVDICLYASFLLSISGGHRSLVSLHEKQDVAQCKVCKFMTTQGVPMLEND
eukprot:1157689-Pelagomonas_calceolata.AAC.2